MNNKGWGVFKDEPGYVVVLPLNDVREHNKCSHDCACMPHLEIIGATLLIVHNAFDFRHVVEWLEVNRNQED